VSMADGEKMKIQDVKVGMEVLSYNEKDNLQEFSKVLNTINGITKELITIKTESGIKINCTKEHPFWIVDSQSGWVPAILLEKGDILMLENGKNEKIESIELKEVPDTVIYNLQIDNNKTYYANEVLVHNKDVMVQEGVTYTGATAQAIIKSFQDMISGTYGSDIVSNSPYGSDSVYTA